MERRTFTREFKLEAVKLIQDRGITMAQAARDLGVHGTVLRRWVREGTADPQQAFPGQGQIKPDQQEIERLRREVTKLKAERDILKNGPHGLPCPLCIETSGGTILQRVDSGRQLLGGSNPVKKPGPGGSADPSVAAPSGDPV